MYHPYFRGKQFELITVRETAPVLAAAKFVPIIEPVKESLGGLQRTLKAVCDAKGKAVVIVNPYHGVHADDGLSISTMLKDEFLKRKEITAGVLLTEETTIGEAVDCCKQHADHGLAIIHAGFSDGKRLADALGPQLTKHCHGRAAETNCRTWAG